MLESQVGPRPRFPQMAHKVILDYTIVEEHSPCNRIRWWLLGKGSISMTMGTSYAHILNYLCVHLHYYKYVFSYFSYKHVMLMLCSCYESWNDWFMLKIKLKITTSTLEEVLPYWRYGWGSYLWHSYVPWKEICEFSILDYDLYI